MHSPRFKSRISKLDYLFSKNSIVKIWKDKVRNDLNSLIVKDPIENLDMHSCIEEEARKINSLVVSGNYLPKEPLRILSEKSKGLCRQIVIPDRVDAIIIQKLSDAVYPSLKSSEPCKKAYFEQKDFSFNNFTKIESESYGTFGSWLRFQKTIFGFAKEHKYIVVTDIANYYDTIHLEHLRNTISAYYKGDMSIVDMLIYSLKSLLWQPDYTAYMPIGLPQMNVDAPRILAHSFLFELDDILANERKVDYTRFMDDIDFGASNTVQARILLRDIDLILQTKQVRLNSGKTKILNQKEAYIHFKIDENKLLDRIQIIYEKKIKTKSNLAKVRTNVCKLLDYWYKNKTFDNGNGEKILKRIITLITQLSGEIDEERILEFYKLRPNIREVLLRYVTSKNDNQTIINKIICFFTNGIMIDHSSIISFTNIICDSRCKKKYNINDLINYLINGNKSEIHSALRLITKFGSEDDILNTVLATKEKWKNDEFLGRAAAATYAFLYSNKNITKFNQIANTVTNKGFEKVFKFLISVKSEHSAFIKISKNLYSANFTKPNKITHSKFAVLLSALTNKSLTAVELTKLTREYSGLKKDIYYKLIINRKFNRIPTIKNAL